MIGAICREYRLSKKVSLAQLTGDTNYQTLYSFETGKSTNYGHIAPYLALAEKFGEVDDFINQIKEAIKIEQSS